MAYHDGVTPLVDKKKATDVIYLEFCKASAMVTITPFTLKVKRWIQQADF